MLDDARQIRPQAIMGGADLNALGWDGSMRVVNAAAAARRQWLTLALLKVNDRVNGPGW